MAKHSSSLQTTNSAFTAGGQNFSGTFIGCIKCAPTTLILGQEGRTVHGRFNIGGNEYQLTGSFKGTSAKGELTDQYAGANLAFELSVSGNHMIFRLAIPEPSTGRILSVILRFQRSGLQARVKNSRQDRDERQYDPVLAGRWKRQNAKTNGADCQRTLSVMQSTIELHIDGTYTGREAEVAAQDPAIMNTGANQCGRSASPGAAHRARAPAALAISRRPGTSTETASTIWLLRFRWKTCLTPTPAPSPTPAGSM